MTIENSINLLHAYKKQAENPINENGMQLNGDARTNAIAQSLKNYEMMKNHILTSRKFRGHPIIEELIGKEEVKEVKVKEKVKEIIKNG